MLSGANHQHVIAIVMIVVFGVQGCAALIYLLYKKVRIPISFSPGGGLAGIGNVIIQDTSAEDIRKAFAKVDTELTEIKKVNASLAETVNEVNSGVKDIRAELQRAGHQAVFWNVISLAFGAAGVVIGILTL